MSSPSEWYNSLPIISRALGTLCLASTVGYHLGVINISWIYLDYYLVTRKFQIWRLVTNLFFLGPFSMHFGMRLLMIARYGVQLEQGPFEKRTADFLWMIISTSITALILTFTIPPLHVLFLGSTLCYMLVYVWSREFPTARVNIMGVLQFEKVELEWSIVALDIAMAGLNQIPYLVGFYLPWALLAVNTMFGAPFLPDLLGIIIGHLHYFLTVLHPRNGGRQLLRTPKWVFKLLSKYRIGEPPRSSPVAQAPPPTQGRVFTGRSYRLNRD